MQRIIVEIILAVLCIIVSTVNVFNGDLDKATYFRREYGYSQETVDALTAERDKLADENAKLRAAGKRGIETIFNPINSGTNTSAESADCRREG